MGNLFNKMIQIKGLQKMDLIRMYSLVDTAGEALGMVEDPLLTPVGKGKKKLNLVNKKNKFE